MHKIFNKFSKVKDRVCIIPFKIMQSNLKRLMTIAM